MTDVANRPLLITQWLVWCLDNNQGKTQEGRKFNNLSEMYHYALSQAKHNVATPDYVSVDNQAQLLYVVCDNWELIQSDFSHDAPLEYKKAVYLAGYSLILELDRKAIYRLAKNLINPLYGNQAWLPNKEAKISLVLAASNITRELYDSADSYQKALNFLSDITDDIKDTDALAFEYYFALGNSYKDVFAYHSAEEAYLKSLSLLESREADIPSARYIERKNVTYSQLARNARLNDDLYKEKYYLSQGGSHTLPTDSSPILRVIQEANNIQSLLNSSDDKERSIAIPKLLDIFKKYGDFFSVNSIATKETYNANYHLHMTAGQIFHTLRIPFAGIIHTYVAIISSELAEEKREMEQGLQALGKDLCELLAGSEGMFWLGQARRQVVDTLELQANIDVTIAWSKYNIGDIEEAITYFEKAIQGFRTTSRNTALQNAYTQYAYITCLSNPELSQKLDTEQKHLFNAHTSNTNVHTGKIIPAFEKARALLLASPDELDEWFEFLRTSKVAHPTQYPILTWLLQQQPENHSSVAGNFYGHLSDRGFLQPLRHYLGVNARTAVEWVVMKSNSPQLKKRFLLEWIINPSSELQELRRGYDKAFPDYKKAYRELRAVWMRYYFEKQLRNSTKNHDAFQQRAIANDNIPERSIKKAYEHYRDINMLENILSTVSPMPSMPFQRTPDIEVNMSNILSQIARGKRPSAHDFGMFPNRFINKELFALLGQNGDPPLLLSLFQATDRAYWTIVDMLKQSSSEPTSLDGIDIIPVTFTRKDSLTWIKRTKDALVSQQEGQAISEETFVDIYRNAHILLAPIFSDYLLQNRTIWLSLPAPYNTLPIEQLPLDKHNTTMLSCAKVIRLDRFSKTLSYKFMDSVAVSSHDIALFANPTQSLQHPTLGNLPSSEDEIQSIAHILDTQAYIGDACTVETVKAQLENCKIAHFACHGYVFNNKRDGFNDYVALLLADDYLLGQEIATLDLQGCELVVLSTCVGATGQQRKLSHIENIAEYFLEAGAKAVMASLTPVFDDETAALMKNFYRYLKTGCSISESFQKIFTQQRAASSTQLATWVIIGADRRFSFQ